MYYGARRAQCVTNDFIVAGPVIAKDTVYEPDEITCINKS